jgi:hypothetical protein
MEKLEYWVCQIGPIDRAKVPYGGDYPLRSAVKKAWEDMFKEQEEHCYSGWGCTEEMNSLLLSVNRASEIQIEQIKKILYG